MFNAADGMVTVHAIVVFTITQCSDDASVKSAVFVTGALLNHLPLTPTSVKFALDAAVDPIGVPSIDPPLMCISLDENDPDRITPAIEPPVMSTPVEAKLDALKEDVAMHVPAIDPPVKFIALDARLAPLMLPPVMSTRVD